MRGAARALGPADRLHQRRGRRLPRRPAQPARRRGGAGQGRRRRGRRGHHRRVTFDWEPTLPAGTLTVEEPRGLGGRGTDTRMERSTGVAADERLAAKKARRMPYELSDEQRTRPRPAGRRRRTRAPRARRSPRAPRVVVKVGSSSLTTLPGGLDAGAASARWSTSGRRVRAAGREVVLVSSGAIAAGLAPLALTGRPRDLATAAGGGQRRAAAAGSRPTPTRFARHGITVGQVLLTADDLARRATTATPTAPSTGCWRSASLPVVNENDTVATEEIRFGDNDRLAALVAHVVRRGRAGAAVRRRRPLRRRPPRRPGAAGRHRARDEPTWPR